MSKGREFESQYSILDVHFSHLFDVKLYCVFERTKIIEKEAGVGPFLKKELKCSIDLWRGFPSVPPPLIPLSTVCVLCTVCHRLSSSNTMRVPLPTCTSPYFYVDIYLFFLFITYKAPMFSSFYYTN